MNMQYATAIARKKSKLNLHVFLPKRAALQAKCAFENYIDVIAQLMRSTHENSRPDISMGIHVSIATRLAKMKTICWIQLCALIALKALSVWDLTNTPVFWGFQNAKKNFQGNERNLGSTGDHSIEK